MTPYAKDDTKEQGDFCQEHEMSFDGAFELTGHGKFNRLVLITCGLVLLNVTMESLGVSYIITAAECDLKLTSEHKGMVTAAGFIGIIITSFFWGYLGDKYGRRTIMLPSIIASAVFSIGSSFSTNFWMLALLRFLTGCFISASSATVYAYLGELHISSRRGSAIAWGSAFISFAFILLPSLAWLIIPGTWKLQMFSMEVKPWRVLMWFWCLPGLCAAAILLMLPESPKFLLAKKNPELALNVLAFMYSMNYRVHCKEFPVKHLKPSSDIAQAGGFAGALSSIASMFKPPLLRCVLISHTSMFAVFLLSSGLYLWVPDILNSILKNTSEDSLSICKIIYTKFEAAKNVSLLSESNACNTEVSIGVFPISIGMGATFAITYIAIGFLINRIGKNNMFSGIMFICGLATIASGYIPQGAVAVSLLVLALCSGCAGSVLAAIAVDVFPTRMRAMAMCVMYMVGRAGAAVGAHILGITLNTHCQLAFLGIGLTTFGSALLILLWPAPEKVRSELEKKGWSF